MPLTVQQQEVIDTLQRPEVSIVTCPAVAGAGKTHTLIEMAKQMHVTNGLYLAYNKAIAVEAAIKFKGTKIQCSTIHSLAYQAVVGPYALKVGFFKTASIKEDVSSLTKRTVVKILEEFCLSNSTNPSAYLDNRDVGAEVHDLVLAYLDRMSNAEIMCTHSFYLKLYHMYLVSGDITPPCVDLLMMDEAGDITALTVEIFRLINSPKKIAVGDLFQNIYSFNNTINGFEALQDDATEVPLTQSFRVSTTIAPDIEAFIARHLDPTFEFKGMVYEDCHITSMAYIARTNAGLLDMMFTLMENNTCFHTTRKIDTILELPLILANLGNGKKITKAGYWQLEKLRSGWEKSSILKSKYSSLTQYILKNIDDDEISNAYDVVHKHGPKDLNTLAKYARDAATKPCDMVLTTAHSSKGLEFDSVTLAPDINAAVQKALGKIREFSAKGLTNKAVLNKYNEELRLYYTACSRAMYELHNAKYLK